jgi:hypothetical protein
LNKWERRVLGILALGGSFLGLVLGSALLVSTESLLARCLLVPFLGLYAWGIWCGTCLLEQRQNSVRANVMFWVVQIPYLTSPIAGYKFASGSLLYVTYSPSTSSPGLLYRFGSQFEYSLLKVGTPFVFGINVLALAVVIWLTYRLRATPPDNSFKPSPNQGGA